MTTLGPTFASECAAAGVVSIAWDTDGTIRNWNDMSPDQQALVTQVIAAHDPTKTLPVIKTWTPLEFMEEFTVEERISMRALAKTDDLAADWLDLLRASTQVRADDQRTIAGANYMVAAGVLTQGRANAILGT